MTFKKNAAPAQTRIPSLAEVSPEYAAANARFNDLKAARNRQADIVNDLWSKTYNAPAASTADRRVAELLGEAPSLGQPSRTEAAELYSAALTELRALDAAVEIAENRLRGLRGAASRIVCDTVHPEYLARVRAVCAAIITLREAGQRVRALAEDLNDREIIWTSRLRPMGINRIAGGLECYLNEAVEYGFIERSELPEEIR